jgi:hypothetical protein
MAKFIRAAIFIALIFSTRSAFAACHVVTQSGSGSKSGADWNNALAGLPSTLTRGDVYYLADGSYGSYSFTTSTSGTTVSEVRKAQSYDHCTDTGWNAGTMGASQAVFTGFGVSASYVTVNGNGTSTVQGCGGAPGASVTANPPNPADCGIKIDNSGCSGGADACDGPIAIGNFSTASAVTGYTFEYVEEKGNGVNNSGRMEIWAPFNRGNPNNGGTFTHMYMHNAGCVYFQNGGDGRHVSYSYFWGTEIDGAPGGACHGQYSFYDLTDSNGTEDHNIYRDIAGTAVHTFAQGGGTHTGWVYYDNIYYYSNPQAFWAPATTGGIVNCINAAVVCNNFKFYQNTIAHVGYSTGGLGSGSANLGNYASATGTGWVVENNLWYDDPSGVVWLGGSATSDHNSCLNSTSGACLSGASGHTADVVSTSSPNPFANASGGNFTLTSDNAVWNNRTALAAPYSTDAAGSPFTTDRGAYEFSGSVALAPQPPTGLHVTVQ